MKKLLNDDGEATAWGEVEVETGGVVDGASLADIVGGDLVGIDAVAHDGGGVGASLVEEVEREG